MTTTIHDRFATLITSLNLNGNSFAASLDVAATQIYNIVNGRNAPSFDLLRRTLLKYPQVNITWILTGTGEPILTVNSTPEYSDSLADRILTLEKKIQDINQQLSQQKEINTPEEALEFLTKSLRNK